jgi:hypothetical protein
LEEAEADREENRMEPIRMSRTQMSKRGSAGALTRPLVCGK